MLESEDGTCLNFEKFCHSKYCNVWLNQQVRRDRKLKKIRSAEAAALQISTVELCSIVKTSTTIYFRKENLPRLLSKIGIGEWDCSSRSQHMHYLRLKA